MVLIVMPLLNLSLWTARLLAAPCFVGSIWRSGKSALLAFRLCDHGFKSSIGHQRYIEKLERDVKHEMFSCGRLQFFADKLHFYAGETMAWQPKQKAISTSVFHSAINQDVVHVAFCEFFFSAVAATFPLNSMLKKQCDFGWAGSGESDDAPETWWKCSVGGHGWFSVPWGHDLGWGVRTGRNSGEWNLEQSERVCNCLHFWKIDRKPELGPRNFFTCVSSNPMAHVGGRKQLPEEFQRVLEAKETVQSFVGWKYQMPRLVGFNVVLYKLTKVKSTDRSTNSYTNYFCMRCMNSETEQSDVCDTIPTHSVSVKLCWVYSAAQTSLLYALYVSIQNMPDVEASKWTMESY